jgi:DMSO/TMAO reductase YedYZ molybdopterin-dependent catalytic subunit
MHLLGVAVLLGQLVQATEMPTIAVRGHIEEPEDFDLRDLGKFKRIVVRSAFRDSTPARFEGVPLKTILEAAGIQFGKNLYGNRLAAFLVVEGGAFEKAVFSLPELDTTDPQRTPILAVAMEGKPLPKESGPFMIVVPHEKTRWIKNVKTLRILHVDNFGHNEPTR